MLFWLKITAVWAVYFLLFYHFIVFHALTKIIILLKITLDFV